MKPRHEARTIKQNFHREKEVHVMTVAQAIQEVGNEVYAALPASISEELAVAISKLEGTKGELDKRMLRRLEEALPIGIRKKIVGSRSYALGGGGLMFPKVKATCTTSKSEIAVGEYATVTVVVDGDEVEQTTPVATSVLFTLDESGSMTSDQNYVQSRNAALTVLNSLRSVDEVGLITFSDQAVVRSSLTTDHQSVKAIIQGLGSPTGTTNLEDAFNKSNNLMTASTASYNRMVILFTDGMPTPDPVAQEKNILNSIGNATSNLIHYYTVGYGSSIPLSLLQILATKTGGQSYSTNNLADLVNFFTSAFEDVKDTLFSSNVSITEIVKPEFQVKQGSLSYSIGLGEEPPGFESAMKAAEAVFYNTRTLTVPIIPILRKNRHFSISFEVTAKNCSPTDQILEVTSPQSHVAYTAGAGTKFTTGINTVSIKVKACGVYWKKYFDESKRRVVIEINNSYPDREVYNVRVVEVTGKDVECWPTSAIPSGFPNTLPYYPIQTKDAWEVYGVEWKLPHPIPANTTQEFSVEVMLRHGIDDTKYGFDNPVQLNQTEVLPIKEPDGKIVNEPMEGGVIEYEVPDDAGIKKKVMIKLPGLTVNELPHQWPFT